jgi:alpha-galactosidase
MNLKISLIGAGSGVFSLSLIRDLCLTRSLEGSTISFMDIDTQRLEGSYNLCRRYAQQLGVNLRFEKTLDREESLRGADFVVNAALAAGHHRLQAGWEIAGRYGYRWGGSLAIMHDEAFWINFYQLRLFESLVEDILRLCPNAWYLMVANPVLGGTTHLLRKYPQLKMTGICHGFSGVYHIASLLGLGREGLTFEMPGVNHFVWLTQMYHQGRDVIPLFRQWVEEESLRYFQTCGMSDHMGPKPVDIYRRFGAVPVGDTATVGGGAWGWWYHANDETEQKWQEDPKSWWERHFIRVAQVARENYTVSLDPNADLTAYLKPEFSGEQIVPVIESLACDIPRTFYINILNTGEYLPGVPKDVAVEVPVMASKRGLQGIQTAGLPPLVLQYLIRDRVVPWEVELAAYNRNSRKLLVELVGLDPWTRSLQQASQFVDDILNMTFHEEMRNYYV